MGLPRKNADQLSEKEVYWRDHYQWLFERGYRLRSRYHPDWVPSWQSDREKRECEDYWNRRVSSTMNDAFQVSDDRHVVLKRVSKSESPEEVKILRYFSQDDVAADPKNHCIPLLDVLAPPDDEENEIVVLPLLRLYDDPPFDTVGEALAFSEKCLKVLPFYINIAPSDVKGDNVLMDSKALGIPDFHFSRQHMNRDGSAPIKPKYRRTERWPRYYLIDFGFSSQYAPEEMPPSVPPLPASDPSLPELAASSHRFDPFPSDVYYIGNWIRMELVDGNPLNSLRPGFKTLEFLRPLIEDMTRHQPRERVTVDEAVRRLDSIVAHLPVTTLRSQLEENTSLGYRTSTLIAKAFAHWRRRLLYIVQRKPPIPFTAKTTPAPSAATIAAPVPKGAADGVVPQPLKAKTQKFQVKPRHDKPSDADIDAPPPQRSAPATPASASFAQRPLSPTSIPLPASPANPTF
ncbi:other/AgaK1 protein kinase [Coprinopsis sp. MPI-PUGE-AT-0042]|nr:other/AgaK1 protein kinase [Coprinopsis sp. MPI-PUGE-AT-0042]